MHFTNRIQMITPIAIDDQLCRKIMSGDRRAYEHLFERFYPELCAYACQWVMLEDAENVVQDIMLWLWQNRKELHIETSIRTYLFAATKNRCLTLINRGQMRQRIMSSLHRIMEEQFESPDFYILGDLVSKLEEALAELPESYREAFVQHRFNNKSYKELATELGVSQKTVEYRISQAIRLLRVSLKDYLPLLILLFGDPKSWS